MNANYNCKELLEKNAELLAENKKLREELNRAYNQVKVIIERAKELRKSLMEAL